MNPRYQDFTGSRRPQPDWVTRGWRRRAELEIERLNAELGALKAAVLYASCHVKPGVPSYFCEDKADVALTELYDLVPGAPAGGGS